MKKNLLPSVSYRISAYYGRVEVARSATSQQENLFVSTMNTHVCAKINSKASPNGIVIGGDLYQIIVNSFFLFIDHNYYFEGVYDDEDEYLTTDSIKDKYHYHPYPVYSILIKNNNNNSNNSNNSDNYGKALNLLKGASKTAETVVVVDAKKQQQQNQKYSVNIMGSR
jgi:hypothetical protein